MINPWLTSAKILHNHYLQFLLGTAAVPKNDGYSFSSFLACEGRGRGVGGKMSVKKECYGQRDSGERRWNRFK